MSGAVPVFAYVGYGRKLENILGYTNGITDVAATDAQVVKLTHKIPQGLSRHGALKGVATSRSIFSSGKVPMIHLNSSKDS